MSTIKQPLRQIGSTLLRQGKSVTPRSRTAGQHVVQPCSSHFIYARTRSLQPFGDSRVLARLNISGNFKNYNPNPISNSRFYNTPSASSNQNARQEEKETSADKVNRYLKYLSGDLQAVEEEQNRRIRLVPATETIEKKSLGTRIVDEVKHYWQGFRLLGTDVRIASGLLLRMIRGDELVRGERRQLERTFADIVRLVPFLAFIIIPMAELALPFYLKLFPNMLPSTFADAKLESVKKQKDLERKIDYAKFLLRTLEEIPLDMKHKDVTMKSNMSSEFKRIMQKIHEEGGYVSKKDLMKFINYFRDDLTLDNFAVSQLRAMCRLLQVPIIPPGTSEIIRFQLHLKIRKLRADDQMIVMEGGVNALPVERLQEACRERGMRVLGMSEARLRQQLRQWLELSQNEQVPETMLILSRAFYFPEDVQFEDRLKKILVMVPDNVAKMAHQRLSEVEGKKINYKERRDIILDIQKALEKERQAKDTRAKNEKQEKEAMKKADELKKVLEMQRTEQANLNSVEGASFKEHFTTSVLEQAELLNDRKSVINNNSTQIIGQNERVLQTTPKEITREDLDEIEVTLKATSGALREEIDDIIELKKSKAERLQDLTQLKESSGGLVAESTAAKRLSNKVDQYIGNLEKLLTNLKKEQAVATAAIKEQEKARAPYVPLAIDTSAPTGQQTGDANTREIVFDTVSSEKTFDEAQQQALVSINELIAALETLKASPETTSNGQQKMNRIVEVLQELDDDHDGIINADLALDVIEILGRLDVKIDAKYMKHIVDLLRVEEALQQKITEECNRGFAQVPVDKSVASPPPPHKFHRRAALKEPEGLMSEGKSITQSDYSHSTVPNSKNSYITPSLLNPTAKKKLSLSSDETNKSSSNPDNQGVPMKFKNDT